MPLRDHFRPPVDSLLSWEELHGMWPAVIVQHLHGVLPEGYVAAPRVRLGSLFEVDVAASRRDERPAAPDARDDEGDGGVVATAAWVRALPIVSVEAAWPDADEYEVRVYDARRGRTLVAAIELISPRNKDRPESRNAFVAKCAELLSAGVAVSLVDLVTTRSGDLFAELLAFVGHAGPGSPPSYAASCRRVRSGGKALLEWTCRPMVIGQPLPRVPLWLSPALAVPLDLEPSYEQACRDLWVP